MIRIRPLRPLVLLLRFATKVKFKWESRRGFEGEGGGGGGGEKSAQVSPSLVSLGRGPPFPFIDSRVGNEEDFSPTELAHRRMERG